MPNLQAIVAAALQPYCQKGTRFWVGLSGGVDSVVLLYLAKQIASEHNLLLSVIHVHHGLHDLADESLRVCQTLCKAWAVPFYFERVVGVPQPGDSVEAWAREKRYQAFKQHVRTRKDVLLLAHHQGDQVETVLLNWIKGAGIKGLSGMLPSRDFGVAKLIRPLLTVTKSQLLNVAKEHRLTWCEDPTNQSERFDRNFLRNTLLPKLDARWPGCAAKMAQSTYWLQEQKKLLDTYIQADLDGIPHDGLAALAQRGEARFALSRLVGWSHARQKALLQAWIEQLALRPLATAQLHELLTWPTLREDARPELVVQGVRFRYYRGTLYCGKHIHDEGIEPYSMVWSGLGEVTPPGFFEAITREKLMAQSGVAVERLTSLRICSSHELKWVKLPNRSHRTLLKKHFQRLNIPPWWRKRLPLIMAEETLLWVFGLRQVRPFEDNI